MPKKVYSVGSGGPIRNISWYTEAKIQLNNPHLEIMRTAFSLSSLAATRHVRPLYCEQYKFWTHSVSVIERDITLNHHILFNTYIYYTMVTSNTLQYIMHDYRQRGFWIFTILLFIFSATQGVPSMLSHTPHSISHTHHCHPELSQLTYSQQ